tara:strand:- start:131 stop:283 length:153 start_codon:yes stop_codon:yes gene_type:complete
MERLININIIKNNDLNFETLKKEIFLNFSSINKKLQNETRYIINKTRKIF